MGTPLTGKTPANTYDALIKIGDNSPLTSNLKVLSDGLGNDLPLTVSSTAITITGNATFSANVDATGAVLTVATQAANAQAPVTEPMPQPAMAEAPPSPEGLGAPTMDRPPMTA